MLLITACQDDDHELGRMLSKSEIDFEVIQDYAVDEGGNTVILRNYTSNIVPMWDYGTGRSSRVIDTVRFPFKGEYTIKFSALTAGGIVEMEPVIIDVTEDNLDYVSDPLWYLLTGGPGQEKTWVLDLDAAGVSKYFDGPLYFYGTDRDVNWECTDPDNTDICWNWNPDYAGNTWLMPTGDYGTMTFNLIGGPFVTIDHKMLSNRGTEEGTYFLNAEERTLNLTGAGIIHNEGNEDCVAEWGETRIVTLTEHTMQLAVMRKESCDGAAYLVYNFISKEFSDNWTPGGEEPEEPTEDPNFDHGDQMEILTGNATRTWKLDTEVPFNWTSLDGEFLNTWNSRADYPDWGGGVIYDDDDVESIDDASIAFSSDGAVIVTQDNGITEEGTYTIDEETNTITFVDIEPSIRITDDDAFIARTTEDNQWKIVIVERNESDEVTGIWLGKRDPSKSEYLVFHFLPN